MTRKEILEAIRALPNQSFIAVQVSPLENQEVDFYVRTHGTNEGYVHGWLFRRFENCCYLHTEIGGWLLPLTRSYRSYGFKKTALYSWVHTLKALELPEETR